MNPNKHCHVQRTATTRRAVLVTLVPARHIWKVFGVVHACVRVCMQACMHADVYACIELTNLLMPSSDWTIKTFQSFQSDEKMGEAAAAGISLFFWCVGPGLGRLG